MTATAATTATMATTASTLSVVLIVAEARAATGAAGRPAPVAIGRGAVEGAPGRVTTGAVVARGPVGGFGAPGAPVGSEGAAATESAGAAGFMVGSRIVAPPAGFGGRLMRTVACLG
jgi:hypothetical protein